jgi:uncharacterized protein (DUF2384 family)
MDMSVASDYLEFKTGWSRAYAARTWMTSPAIGLGGRSAAELLGTEEGRQQLLDNLARLDMGVYS